jgi:hypothetical protein
LNCGRHWVKAGANVWGRASKFSKPRQFPRCRMVEMRNSVMARIWGAQSPGKRVLNNINSCTLKALVRGIRLGITNCTPNLNRC